MCGCAAAATDCMTRPGVASIDCAGHDCCGSSELTLAGIDAATKTWFDVGAEPGHADEGTADEVALMTRWASFIDLAHREVAGRVCLGRYAADCTVTVDVCSTSLVCCCATNCGTSCPRPGVRLPELDRAMHPDRVLTATINDEPVPINDPPSSGYGLTTHRGWALTGLSAGVEVTLTLALRGRVGAWDEAVKALACERFNATRSHQQSCDSAAEAQQRAVVAAQLAQAGLTGVPMVDALSSTCSNGGGIGLGSRSAVTSIRWATSEGLAPPAIGGSWPLLAAIEALATAADQIIYLTGVDEVDTAPLTEFMRSVLAAADADEAKTLLEVAAGGSEGEGTVFTFTTPTTVWTVNHALGRKPGVVAQYTDGREFYPALDYPDDNTLTITFKTAQTGAVTIV